MERRASSYAVGRLRPGGCDEIDRGLDITTKVGHRRNLVWKCKCEPVDGVCQIISEKHQGAHFGTDLGRLQYGQSKLSKESDGLIPERDESLLSSSSA